MEAISILLGVLFCFFFNLGLPADGYKLGQSSRVTISGATAFNYREFGYKKTLYFFIDAIFFYDPKHMDKSYDRFIRYKKHK